MKAIPDTPFTDPKERERMNDILTQYEPVMRRYLHSRFSSLSSYDCDEAVSEVMYRACKMRRILLALPSHALEQKLISYTHHAALHRLQQNKRQSAHTVPLVTEWETPDGDTVSHPRTQSPDFTEAFAENENDLENIAKIRRHLDIIGAPERDIVLLHIGRELTFREIGALLGMNPHTVATKYQRTVEKIKKEMGVIKEK